MSNFLINPGVTVVDKITGFNGIVTGRADYITGCNQYLVQPKTDGDGKHVDSRWFDEHRLTAKEDVDRVVLEPVEVPGACEPAPIK
jgi:hypothetical protein